MTPRALSSVPLLALVAGCLSSAPPSPMRFTLDLEDVPPGPRLVSAPLTPSARLARVMVRAPYDGESLVVLRADGTVAFDPAHAFAASPFELVEALASEEIVKSGVTGAVVAGLAPVESPLEMGLDVTRFALDCRGDQGPTASVRLVLYAIEGDSRVVRCPAEASVPVRSRTLGAAFSEATATALRRALVQFVRAKGR